VAERAGSGDGIAGIGHNRAAFDSFYRTHVDAVGRFIARRVSDPHTAADLTAEVFLAVIDSAHTYRADRGTEIGWLFGVARNVIAGERRRAAREHQTTGRIAGRRLLDPDDLARIEERIDACAGARATYVALAGLPDDNRALLELIAVDGLSVAEAAAALGISPVAVRVRLHRARKVLRAVISQPHPALA
jgi:RNA polymerase sigma-70 factor (ECF subfamily)